MHSSVSQGPVLVSFKLHKSIESINPYTLLTKGKNWAFVTAPDWDLSVTM